MASGSRSQPTLVKFGLKICCVEWKIKKPRPEDSVNIKLIHSCLKCNEHITLYVAVSVGFAMSFKCPDCGEDGEISYTDKPSIRLKKYEDYWLMYNLHGKFRKESYEILQSEDIGWYAESKELKGIGFDFKTDKNGNYDMRPEYDAFVRGLCIEINQITI